ncbi:MAG: rhodanese-like domain-containing protein [Treponemataceae bacterium]
MKKAFIALVALSFVAPLFARDVEAIVTADWLEKNLSNSKVVVVDVRKVEDYKAAHIPGAVSMLGASLYVPKAGLNNELPEIDDLSDLIADAGIDSSSIVVVVEADGIARFAWATRVAWTFAYAGLDNVTVLSGGQAGWVKSGKAVSSDIAKPKASKFKAKARPAYLALKADVLASKGQIVDARNYDTYFGIVKQGFVAQAGHFPGATPLPYNWIMDADGLVKSKETLAAMPALLKLNPNAEIITYCDSGVLCTTWWWVFKEYMGWKNVRSYDGSSQDLTKDASVKYVTHLWK